MLFRGSPLRLRLLTHNLLLRLATLRRDDLLPVFGATRLLALALNL